MKATEIRQMSQKQLVETLKKLRRERAVLRFKVSSGQENNFAKLKSLKSDIARVRTLMREKELQVSAS